MSPLLGGGSLLSPVQGQLQADQRYRSIDFGAADPVGRAYIPTFTKYSGNPVFQTVNLTALTSLGSLWVLRVDDIFGGVGHYGERYRMYYSTDHETTTSAVGLMTAPALLGPWTDQGQVFKDTSAGNQTETPAVLYVPETSTFMMYYHQIGATGEASSEVTKLATMSLATAKAGADSWTISTAVTNGIVLDIPADSAGWPANGGWAYFRPFRIGQMFYGHLRNGGGIDQSWALAKSRDGINWQQDPRMLYFGADKLIDTAGLGRFNQSSHYIAWGNGNVLQWNGLMWWIGPLVAVAASPATSTYSYQVMAPISRDFRKFLAAPTVIFTTNQSWESNYAQAPAGMGNCRSGQMALVGPDGKLYLFYLDGYYSEVAGAAGASGIGIAVGS